MPTAQPESTANNGPCEFADVRMDAVFSHVGGSARLKTVTSDKDNSSAVMSGRTGNGDLYAIIYPLVLSLDSLSCVCSLHRMSDNRREFWSNEFL